MIRNEGDLAHNVQTLKDKCEKVTPSNAETCSNAYKEVQDFMKKDGNLQTQLKDRGLISLDGNSVTFSSQIYPSEKQDK